jgi:hypothetical protein
MNTPDRNNNPDQPDSDEINTDVEARRLKTINDRATQQNTQDLPDGLRDYQGNAAETLLGNHSFHRRTSRGGKVDTSGVHRSDAGSSYDTQEYIREHQE